MCPCSDSVIHAVIVGGGGGGGGGGMLLSCKLLSIVNSYIYIGMKVYSLFHM